MTNNAYRWFLGLGLTDRVPDHSTISLNRKRFEGSTIIQDIFDEIVEQAKKHRKVSGRLLFTDSTHLKANTNKRKYVIHEVEQTTREYLDELDQAVEMDRLEHGKKL